MRMIQIFFFSADPGSGWSKCSRHQRERYFFIKFQGTVQKSNISWIYYVIYNFLRNCPKRLKLIIKKTSRIGWFRFKKPPKNVLFLKTIIFDVFFFLPNSVNFWTFSKFFMDLIFLDNYEENYICHDKFKKYFFLLRKLIFFAIWTCLARPLPI